MRASSLRDGELAFATDTKELFIGLNGVTTLLMSSGGGGSGPLMPTNSGWVQPILEKEEIINPSKGDCYIVNNLQSYDEDYFPNTDYNSCRLMAKNHPYNFSDYQIDQEYTMRWSGPLHTYVGWKIKDGGVWAVYLSYTTSNPNQTITKCEVIAGGTRIISAPTTLVSLNTNFGWRIA